MASNFTKAQTAGNNEKNIRVLTFNILHGATTKGDFNLDVIADVIIKINPDLVALQEVDYKTTRAREYDLVMELGYRAKMVPLFGRAMYFDNGEYGEAILSKTTIIDSRVVDLPYLEGDEPRVALEITTVIGKNDTISFIGTHLDHVKNDTNRIMQVKKINSMFSNNKYPTILAGDLNDNPGSNVINILESLWSPAYNPDSFEFTFPSDKPSKKIDYIMFKPQNSFIVIKTEVIQDEIASDHCAYLAILKVNK
jgi:endonuclease/exonuclease/phosphatase family metal-dependent hydrolase